MTSSQCDYVLFYLTISFCELQLPIFKSEETYSSSNRLDCIYSSLDFFVFFLYFYVIYFPKSVSERSEYEMILIVQYVLFVCVYAEM